MSDKERTVAINLTGFPIGARDEVYQFALQWHERDERHRWGKYPLHYKPPRPGVAVRELLLALASGRAQACYPPSGGSLKNTLDQVQARFDLMDDFDTNMLCRQFLKRQGSTSLNATTSAQTDDDLANETLLLRKQVALHVAEADSIFTGIAHLATKSRGYGWRKDKGKTDKESVAATPPLPDGEGSGDG